MTGAITQAGYGALAGGVLSSVTGGKFSDGMRTGAIGGAVTGGLLGAAGIGTDPLAGKLGGQQGGALKTMPVPEQTIGVGTPMGADGGLAAGVPTPTSGPSSFLPTTPGTAGGAAGRLGGLLGKGGWIERNGTLAGNVIGGLGQGLMGAAEADAIRQGQKDRFAQIEKNYGDVDPGAYYTQAAPGESQQSPTERFDPSTYGQWEYKYDAKQGRIVRAPVG
jgi:hypothetical protein